VDRNDRLPITSGEAEMVPLAGKLAKSFTDFVAFYEEAYKLSREDALERARLTVEDRQRIMNAPACTISWMDIGQMTEADPDAGMEVWDKVRHAARMEILSGHRAAGVVSQRFDFGPLAQARFLEVRQALRNEWNPSEGSESALIDMLAQIQTAWEEWMGKHMLQATMESAVRPLERSALKEGAWLPPRVGEVEAQDQSAVLADRFNKMYLRTLRALRDLRRHAPQIVVQNAGQVNVGHQQINVQSDE
jgi:hypothetical protein